MFQVVHSIASRIVLGLFRCGASRIRDTVLVERLREHYRVARQSLTPRVRECPCPRTCSHATDPDTEDDDYVKFVRAVTAHGRIYRVFIHSAANYTPLEWSEPMPRSRKVNLEKVLASLDTVCPKCGKVITPAEVKRIDFERIECPACEEQFDPAVRRMAREPSSTARG